ncbi:PREDICTED: uncharacterized protein LOC105563074 isoform X2 [Vollenhovia emeryi]|uniref:uncharacterized protein LOC105563074 isoform X2 n=1 Tax=Vollenhovia emeryi TaxID=411798 RepID=UPI0005F4F485|nr:PREDICTED: uncharacterized protein LOC105563074 isoform X2 [Vollenhovia emeryi]
MKNYACAILLLMCVMSYSNCETYQDSGVVSINLAANCAYEGLFYTEGVHTLHQPCRVLKCYPDGDSIIEQMLSIAEVF